MYQALYRVERPETFDRVLGQDHIVRVLRNQIDDDSTSHAYLFCGTRGTGKTSVARLLAKGVNCTGEGEKPCGVCPNCQAIKEGTFVDVIEIDAASNNGVENVRELRESVNYPPSAGRKKVYIIDEVHMLTVPAFNALLKTLEEPPENVMFILATTDPQKLPQTILSRCMRFDFKRVPDRIIAEDMKRILEGRDVSITDDALKLLAANADGSVRDGLSLLDQCIAGTQGAIDRDDVLTCLGAVSDDFYIRLTDSIIAGNAGEALLELEEVMMDGKDARQILGDWLSHYRALLISKYIKDPENLLNMSGENAEKVAAQSRRLEMGDINNGIRTIARTINDARYSTQPRTLMELAIVTLASGLGEEQVEPMARSRRALNNQRTAARKDEGAAERDDTNINGAIVNDAAKETLDIQEETIAAAAEDTHQEPANSGREDAVKDQESGKDADLDDIWEDMWESLGDDLGSLYMVRINSALAGLTESEFKVICGNDFVKTLAENNRSTVEEAMSKILGRHVTMAVKIGSSKPEAEEERANAGSVPAEDIAAQLQAKFNLNTKIE